MNIRNANIVRILLNDGAGMFATHADYATGGDIAGGAAADLDNDGLLDLVVVSVAGSLEVRFNQGGGVLGPPSVIHSGPFGGYPSVIAKDLNHDGYVDVAATDFSGVQVCLNMGGGQFAAAQAYPANSKSLVAGDFNGDTDTDLASVTGYQLVLLFNQGDGTFFPATVYDGDESPNALATADFNGDDKLDFAVADRTASKMIVHLSMCWP